jgi:hypothetical protein
VSTPPSPEVPAWPALTALAEAAGLSVRGAFHPEPGEFDSVVRPPRLAATCVLLGFAGRDQWRAFADSAEAADHRPHPLDRWSRRVIDALACAFDAAAIYPSDRPNLPFQQLAMRCEPVHQSPIGLLIHPLWGLWHAYRGALFLPRRIDVPVVAPSAHPCEQCAARPCLSTCPVGAFSDRGFDLAACIGHVESIAGTECRDRGCLARRACPVGPDHRYRENQARFHMAAFLAAGQRTIREES